MCAQHTRCNRAAAGALGLGAVTGSVLVAQNGINTNLRTHAIGDPLLTAFASFTVGFFCVSAICSVEYMIR